MKKCAVVGNGKLGSLLRRKDGFFPFECDLTDYNSILVELDKVKPDLIINLGAISNIDECERDYEKAIRVNVHGTANLHKAFGSGVLTISTDHVFNGKKCTNKESSKPYPINNYGWTKVGAEAISRVWGGKIIRLSRTVSIEDGDISDWLLALHNHDEIYVPNFIYRNFTHRKFAVDGISYFAKNYDTMPDVVHYGGNDNYNFYDFMLWVADEFGFDTELVNPRKFDEPSYSPRPMNGGFSVALAKKLRFPIYKISDTIEQLVKEDNLK